MVETSSQITPELPPATPPPKPARKKWLIIGIGVVIVLVIGGLVVFTKEAQAPEASNSPEATIEVAEPKTVVRMLATGDWIAHDAINARAKTANGYDYAPMTAQMASYFADSDINFCNQATLAGGEAYGISGYPVFNAPTEWIRDLKGLGCNVINTGTNHTNDKGQRPITAQLETWDTQAVLAVAGSNRSAEEQQRVRYFEKDGVKFALLSYSTYTNIANPNPFSLNLFKPELYESQLKEANEKADIVIVSMRWGTEYSPAVNGVQESTARTLANLGADIILGHGPHVLQPVNRLPRSDGTEAIVWYSLGNFLNAQLETEALTGCVATFTIDIATKTVLDTTCLPFYQHFEWTAEEKAREDLLARSNFLIMPLYKAESYLAKSQLNTTIEVQTTRIQELVNTYTKVPVQTSDGL